MQPYHDGMQEDWQDGKLSEEAEEGTGRASAIFELDSHSSRRDGLVIVIVGILHVHKAVASVGKLEYFYVIIMVLVSLYGVLFAVFHFVLGLSVEKTRAAAPWFVASVACGLLTLHATGV